MHSTQTCRVRSHKGCSESVQSWGLVHSAVPPGAAWVPPDDDPAMGVPPAELPAAPPAADPPGLEPAVGAPAPPVMRLLVTSPHASVPKRATAPRANHARR